MVNEQNVAMLLKQLEVCQDSMGVIPEEARSSREIKIYRKLIRLEPDNVQFKYCLAKLLLGKGQDEKMGLHNYADAFDLFEEVLELNPEYAQAHYHMGWLARYKKHWVEAIDHFAAALVSPALGHLDQLYSYCSQAYCLAKIGKNHEALRSLTVAKELAQGRMELNYVEEAEHMVSLVSSSYANHLEQNRPFVFIDNTGKKTFITLEESDFLASEKGSLILDLRARRPACIGLRGLAKLEDGEAQLLEYLWVRPGYQRASEIKKDIWPETPSVSVVKTYIKKLRSSLYECFPSDSDDLIENMPRVGYRWQSNTPYRIIKPVTFTWTRYY